MDDRGCWTIENTRKFNKTYIRNVFDLIFWEHILFQILICENLKHCWLNQIKMMHKYFGEQAMSPNIYFMGLK